MTNGAQQAQPRATVEAHFSLAVLSKLALFVLVTVIVIAAIGRAQQLFGLVMIAGVLAALVSPLVERFQNRVSGVAAALVVHILVFVVIIGLTGAVVLQIQSESEHLETYAAEQLAELDPDTTPLVFGRADLSDRASRATASWGTTAVLGDDAAGGIAMRASQLVVILVLSIFFTLQGDRVINAAVKSTADRSRRRDLRLIWSDAIEAGAIQLRHALLRATAIGFVASIVAAAFDLPGIALLGFWAAVISAVPLIGPPIGWAPIIVVGALTHPPAIALLLAAVAIAVIILSSRLAKKTSPAFDIGPLILTVGIAAGVTAAGLPGAAVGLFAATAVAHAVARHWQLLGGLIGAGVAEQETDDQAERAQDQQGENAVLLPSSAVDSAAPERVGIFVDLSSSTLIRIAGLVVLAVMAQLSISSMGTILIWVVVGLLIAIGLDRPVTWICQHADVPRALVVITGSLIFAAGLFGVATASRGGVAVVGSIDDDIPRFAESLENLPFLGSHFADLEIARAIGDFQSNAPDIINRSPLAGRAVALVGGGVIALFWIVAMTMASLIDGPRVVAAIDRRISARYTRQVTRITRAARSALAGYVAGSALVAAINALLTGLLATVAGVPMPVMMALWAFSWNFVPQIGAIVGWAPVLLLALIINPVVGAGCVAFFIMYQVIENNLIQPTIVGHAVDISALAALGAALTGAAVAGLVGAVLAIPFVGVVHAIRTEIQSDDFPSLERGTPL